MLTAHRGWSTSSSQKMGKAVTKSEVNVTLPLGLVLLGWPSLTGVYSLKGDMNTVAQMTIQDVLQKLTQYGFKECTKDVRSQCDRKCLYVFERLGDESGVYYDCETMDDVFALLSLVEAPTSQ